MGSARVVRVLAVVAFVAGCASSTPTPSAETSSPTASQATWPSDDAYGQLFAQVRPDGSVSKDVALQAFSMAIATLPGVPAPTGGPPSDFEREDGTFAINWLMPYLDQLTPDQLAVVNQVLSPGPSPSAVVVDPARPVAEVGPGLPAVPAVAADPDTTPYTDAIASAESIIASRLHRDLQAKIDFAFGPPFTTSQGLEALAYTNPGGLAGPNLFCHIIATPSLQAASQAWIAVTMAHEVFHCFQFEAEPNHGRSASLDWIVEGQAEWAGEDVAGPTSLGADWWSAYLSSPQVPLFQRTYDAVGFYEHLAETGTSPWSIFDAMLATPTDSIAAYKAAGAVADNFLDSWASGMTRTTYLPSTWDAHGRWSTDAHAPVQAQDLYNGDLINMSAPAVTNADWAVNARADVTELSFEGHARMYTDQVDTPEVTTVDLCTNTTADGCKCPQGTYYDGPPLQASDGVVFLGLTGSLDGTSGTVRGRPISDFCDPNPQGGQGGNPAPRGGSDPCAQGCAGSIGDPHFQTLDYPDEFYNFQAAGEFTLLRSPDGSMEMQGRQVPYSGDIPNVSINSALAWRIAGHRVAMYANPGSDTYSMTMDGQPLAATPARSIDLGSGAALTLMSDGIEVAYPDGTIATVFFHGNGIADALDLNVAPSATFRAQAVGLLAKLAPGSDLPALPDGTALPSTTDQQTSYTQRYKQLEPAWLVTDQTSLFDYQPGQTTATFYNPSYPSEEELMDPDLGALQGIQGAEGYDQATDQCAGVQEDPEQYVSCVFDTVFTGDDQFSQFYQILEQFFTAGPTVLETPQASAPPSTPTPEPTVSGALPAGIELVDSGVAEINGVTVAADGTVYASLSMGADYTPELVSVLPNGQPGAKVQPAGVGRLFLLDGSLWLAEDAGGGVCQVERFDPTTLASQAKIPIVCDLLGADATAVSDGIWWADGSGVDANGHGGMLRHIDPATNTVDKSVALPFINGNLSSSGTTVIYGDSGTADGWYKLAQGGTAMTQIATTGLAIQAFAANDGFWYQPADVDLQNQVNFANGGSSETTLPVDGYLEAADDHAVYVTPAGGDPETLVRYPTDGSGPATILTGVSVATPSGSDDLGFFDNNPLVIANQKLAKFWLASDYAADGSNSVLAETISVP